MEVSAGPKDHHLEVAPPASGKRRRSNGLCYIAECDKEGDSSSSSSKTSSIGVESTYDSNDDNDDEVQSKLKQQEVGLSSLDSLAESLPIKRGLSSFYSGKSRSFACLSEAGSADELAKKENPFNKRRRILKGGYWLTRRASCSSLPQPAKMVEEEEEEEESDQEKAY